MGNKVHVASDSSSSPSTGTVTSSGRAQRKKIWIIAGLIAAILIITTIVVPITIVLSRDANNTTSIVATTSKTTSIVGTTSKTTSISARTTTTSKTTSVIKTTTTNAPIQKTTTSIIHPSTAQLEDNSNITENIINVWRWKFVDPFTQSARYWYKTGEEPPGQEWTRDILIFRGYNKQVPGTEPIYVYHTEISGVWHNTLQIDPISSAAELDQWKQDSISLYTYRTQIASGKLQAIHRYYMEYYFQNNRNQVLQMHLLTAETEPKEQSGWVYEKIIFYGLPPEE